MSDYKVEFPDFEDGDFVIPEGFEDASWHNEEMPRFVNEALCLCLWVDYLNPDKSAEKQREPESDWYRYQLVHYDPDFPLDSEKVIIRTNHMSVIHNVLKRLNAPDYINNIDTFRFNDALAEAFDAFWQSIKKAFPDASSGDLSPDMTAELEKVGGKALTEWLDYNHSHLET